MKKLIGWILFYLGIILIQWVIYASTFGSDELSWQSIPGILIISACFIGWFVLAFIPGRREKKELAAMHQAYLERERKEKEYQAKKQ